MSWTFVIPLKPAAARKQRLSPDLPPDERVRLSEQWLGALIAAARPIGRVLLLSERPSTDASIGWLPDAGRGLNAELDAAYAALRPHRTAIVHADLPQVTSEDLRALIAAAESAGCAIAPDRHGTGTNALALADGRAFHFAFGENSFARHRSAAGKRAATVIKTGLGLDIDTPADWAAAQLRDA